MMQLFSFLFLAAFYASNTFAEHSSGTRPCPGGYSHGTQVDVGRYWYECQDGQMIPKGCLAEDGRRVDVDRTFDTDKYRMQCVMDKDGYLSVIYKACVFKNREHDVGVEWDDGRAYFTCVKQGVNVRVITLGCVDQGRKMKLDDRVAKGDFIFQCKKNTIGKPKVNKVGCVHEGRKYDIGEQYEGSKFWYTCTDSGSKIVGCMYESHRLKDGDHYTKNDMMYSCKVNGDQTDFEPFACLQKEENGASIERKVGCSWVEGRGSEAYEYTCKADDRKHLSKVRMQCVYRASQGMFKLQPGCATVADPIAVECAMEAGSLKIKTYNANKIDQLRKC